ncbi:MAG: outer membrane beta-barrel protein [Bacteroidetes bacterium]|nr:outer membrane beta-barrel protein [Bacteroidota bacterium]
MKRSLILLILSQLVAVCSYAQSADSVRIARLHAEADSILRVITGRAPRPAHSPPAAGTPQQRPQPASIATPATTGIRQPIDTPQAPPATGPAQPGATVRTPQPTHRMAAAGSDPRGRDLSISGTILDATDSSELASASVSIAPVTDTMALDGVLTEDDGHFEIDGLSPGRYRLQVSYISYKGLTLYVTMDTTDVDIGDVMLHAEGEVLHTVTVTAQAVSVQQKADTTEYNAAQYKVNPDATAEDLVSKMPGISSTNGTVTAHGETVQKVLVDGKEFFGDDATTALKSLPADVIDKVQVYDRLSDQSAFTGFDDGNTQKTINVKTKKGRNNGVFGRLYAGYGYIDASRYSAGGNVNWFNGDHRISLIGMSNNINQQNFSSQDLLGVSGTGGGRGRGSSSGTNFMIGSQGGISTTQAIGLNYSDTWGKKKKVKVSGSYFFNYTDNTTLTSLNRNYYSGSKYTENDTSRSTNQNHRINLRIEYAIDSFNQFIFTPKLSYQANSQYYGIGGQTMTGEGVLSSTTNSRQHTYNNGYNAAGDILYQHKFKKPYRTLSVDLGVNINNKGGHGDQQSHNMYYDTASVADTAIIDQQTYTNNKSYALNANVSYTEPAGKNGMIQLNYQPSYTYNKADKRVDSLDPLTLQHSLLDTALSNRYDNTYMTQRAGISYRYKNKGINLNIGVNGQYALLQGQATFPFAYGTDRTFYSVLPHLSANIKFKNSASLRIQYRTSTSAPSISQLQNVIDNSNPLLLSTGNPGLNQSYANTILLRYSLAKTAKGHSLFVFANVTNTMNTVASAAIIAGSDTNLTVNNTSVYLHKGSQLSRPVNINGQWSASTLLTYGVPLPRIKCNINVNGGLNYNQTPGLINNALNLSRTYAPSLGANLTSNISEKIDFSIGYSGTYSVIQNSLQKAANNNYYTHSATARFNWLFWKGFVFNTALQNTLYQGVSSGYNQNIFLWSAALGYKFLKDQSLEVRASVNDILNQNSGVSRNITQTYIEDDRTQVLRRYMLVTVTWTMRYFKKGAQMPPAESGMGDDHGGRGRNFPGGPPPGGGPGGQHPGGGPGGF